MSVPGAGLLAALRRKGQQPEGASQPDDPRFAARSSAVHAMEQAVAADSAPEAPKRGAACGRRVPLGDFVYYLDAARSEEEQPELTYVPVTRVAAEYREAHLRQVAVNEQYISYGLKQGHIRVLHRFSEARALLKGHTGPVADLCFIDDDRVAAGGQDGQLFVWRLQAVDGDNALHVAQLLHVQFAPGCGAAPVRLASAAAAPGTLVVAVGGAVVALAVPASGTQDLRIDLHEPAPAHAMPNFPADDAATAVAVSPDGKLVAAGGGGGRVYVCRVEGGELAQLENCSMVGPEASAVSAVEWLAAGDDGCSLLVSSEDGARHRLYHCGQPGAAAFVAGGSISLQAGDGGGGTAGPSPFAHTGVVRERRLVVLADTRRKAVYVVHWSGPAACATFDYVMTFRVGLPILNFAPVWDPDAGDEGAVELNCVQTEAVQQYFLDPELCWDEGAASAPPAQEAQPLALSEAQPSRAPAPVQVEVQPSGALPQPAEELVNGAAAASGGATKERATVAAAAAAAAAAALRRVKAEKAPEPAKKPPPVILPPPGPSPKLLTPKDLLRASAAEAAAKQPLADEEGKAASPAPGSQPQPSVKILQRPSRAPEPPPPPPPGPGAEPVADGGTAAPGPAAADAGALSAAQLKLADHVALVNGELFKALRAEFAAQAAAQQAAVAALVREAVEAQAAAAARERAAVVAEERAGTERLLAAISTTLNRDLPARLQEALRSELAAVGDTMARSVMPAVQQAVQASLPKDLAAAVRGSLDKQLPGALSSTLGKPLGESFRAAFAKQIIPAFEGAVQAMFKQVEGALAKGLADHLQASREALAEPAGLAASLRDSLGAAQGLAEALRRGQEGLLRSVAGAGAARAPPVAAAVDVRAELQALVAAARYEEAFTRALGLQDVGTVAWLCGQADPAAVLALEPPALSQMVLLSLVQQLASDLGAGAGPKLRWLREAAMVLDPSDPALAPHLRPVLEQVTAALQAALKRLTGADASACKLAMHVVHSQMTS